MALSELFSLAEEKKLQKIASRAAKSYDKLEAVNILVSNPVKALELVCRLPNNVLEKFLKSKGIQVKSNEDGQTLVENVKKYLRESEAAGDNATVLDKVPADIPELARKVEDMKLEASQKSEKLVSLANKHQALADELNAVANKHQSLADELQALVNTHQTLANKLQALTDNESGEDEEDENSDSGDDDPKKVKSEPEKEAPQSGNKGSKKIKEEK